jgi:hypothetical protein
LPRGLAAALEGESAARLQLLTSDGGCLEGRPDAAKKADGEVFKPKGKPRPTRR